MNKEIPITIFSKDRACQVSACIDSLFKNLDEISTASISVLYKATSNSFEEGYKKAVNIHFHKKIN